MIEVADNAKHAGPGRGQSEAAPSSGARRAFAGKRIVLGIGLLLLAVVLWSLRDTVPSWLASRMAATVELATTNERDDARVTRAFDAAMRSQAADATLESLPNQTKVRHSRLTVRAPSSNEAIEQASRLAVVMAATFKNEGEGTLSVDIRRRTTPVGDRTTAIAGTAMTVAAARRRPARRPAARGGLVAPAVRPRSPAAALLVAGGWRPGAGRGADLPVRRHHHGAVLHGHSGADRRHHRVEGDAAPPGRELALDARAHHQVEDPRPASPPRR